MSSWVEPNFEMVFQHEDFDEVLKSRDYFMKLGFDFKAYMLVCMMETPEIPYQERTDINDIRSIQHP